MCRFPAVIIALLIGRLLPAQYGAGSSGGTWEGLWGVNDQPASILLHDDRAEINVVRFGADGHNSYFQLRRSSFGLFGFGKRIEVNTNEAELREIGMADRSVVLDVRIQGPSFSLRLSERSALAFTMGLRGNFTALDLDQLARKFGVDTLVIENGQSRRLDEAALRGAAISWMEFGPTYGRTIGMGPLARLHAAVSAKYAMGIFGSSVDLRPPTLSGVNDSVQVLSDVDLDYAIATPDEADFRKGPKGWSNGQGWNCNAGVVVELLRQDSIRDRRGHRLRVGAAISDLGSITFTKEARKHVIRDGSTTIGNINAMDIAGVDQVDSALSTLLLNDPKASLAARSFAIGLPANLHGSIDFSPWRAWALRVETVFGLRKPPIGTGVRDQLSIVPRFETRMICVAVPVTIDRFQNTAVGLSLRVGGFMIGSDRIGGLFGLNDVSGADVYCGAKVRLRSRP